MGASANCVTITPNLQKEGGTQEIEEPVKKQSNAGCCPCCTKNEKPVTTLPAPIRRPAPKEDEAK